MNIAQTDLEREVRSFSSATIAKLYTLAEAHGGGLIGVPLLIAFASRETDCRNIVGDHGFGRGMFQQDTRFWRDWLSHQPGCRSETNKPVKGHSAAEPGYVPTIEAGATKCLLMFVDSYRAARAHGYTQAQARKIAVSAYNAGLGGALSGQRAHGDSDHNTTGRDYAADVLARASAVHHILTKGAKK